MYPGRPFTVTVTPSTFVGRKPPARSAAPADRLVAARFVPLIVMTVFGAMPAVPCAALVIPLVTRFGFAWMLPRIPCFWPPGPAVKYTVSLSPPLPPLPTYRDQRPGI